MSTASERKLHEAALSERQDVAQFGFWIYLLSDVMIFGSLFATFIVLRHNTAGGPDAKELFEPSYVLVQTLLLLASSLTCAVALLAAKHGRAKTVQVYLTATFALGALFLTMELLEFMKIITEGYSWQTSAFLSSFTALVGTHGLHIFFGLIWLAVLLARMGKKPMDAHFMRRLGLFGLFWHFLDIIWIFVFVIVYMFGVAGV